MFFGRSFCASLQMLVILFVVCSRIAFSIRPCDDNSCVILWTFFILFSLITSFPLAYLSYCTFLSRLVTLCSDCMSPFGDFFKQFLSETWHWENFVDGSIIPSPHFSFVRLIMSNVPLIGISSHNLMYLCASESSNTNNNNNNNDDNNNNNDNNLL